jgi:hypothetical protein
MKAFTKSLSSFKTIVSLTISTPLGPSFEPEERLVEDLALHNVTLYKRGAGDKFHPWLHLIGDCPGNYHANLIHTCRTEYVRSRAPTQTAGPTNTTFNNRQVRLAIKGGNHHVLREV